MASPVSISGRRLSSSVGGFVLLLVTLAGLFAMHGLSDHGAAGHSQSAEAPMGASHASPIATTSTALVDSGEEGVSDASAHLFAPGHEMSAMGLCLAVLMSGLLLVLARHLFRPAFVIARSRVYAVKPRRRPRAADPPNLIALSILRC